MTERKNLSQMPPGQRVLAVVAVVVLAAALALIVAVLLGLLALAAKTIWTAALT